MKTQVIVKELENVARQLGFGIRKGKGNFKGGRCIVAGDELIVLNKHHIPEKHLSVLAEGLRDQSIEGIEMKPAVRKALEQAWEDLEVAAKEAEEAAEKERLEAEASSAGEDANSVDES